MSQSPNLKGKKRQREWRNSAKIRKLIEQPICVNEQYFDSFNETGNKLLVYSFYRQTKYVLSNYKIEKRKNAKTSLFLKVK